jgi:hypothetical protein
MTRSGSGNKPDLSGKIMNFILDVLNLRIKEGMASK